MYGVSGGTAGLGPGVLGSGDSGFWGASASHGASRGAEGPAAPALEGAEGEEGRVGRRIAG